MIFKCIKHVWMAAALAALLLSGCRQAPQTPPAAFADIVKAYTGGAVPDGGAVRVEFAADVPGARAGQAVPEGCISFTPALKGQAVWSGASGIAFTPEAGTLKPGKEYRCNVRMDKLLGLSAPELATFSFPFRAAEKCVAAAIEHVFVPTDNPAVALAEGVLRFSQTASEETVRAMLPEGSEFELAEEGGYYRFTLPSEARGTADRTLTLCLKEAGGFKVGDAATAVIPGTDGAFRVIASRIVEDKTPFIELAFSDPAAEINGKGGGIMVYGIGRGSLEQTGNILRIYYDQRTADEITVVLYDIVKSMDGRKLEGGYQASFAAARPKPEVQLQLQGNILPDEKALVLPFRAVNLTAVDLSVIKIYESNMPVFLQDNELGGEDGLRRSGRKILTRTIPLDGQQDQWGDYSIDLSDLFKQEPGALYRIRLSFRQEYATWGNEAAPKGLTFITSPEQTDDNWDYPSPWYYENFIDWSEYDWNDREDPSKPSYYMVESRFPCVNLLASNLGMIAQYAGGDKLWASVSDIVTANPLGGVQVQALNFQLQPIGEDKTDGNGLAEISLSGKPFLLIARRGGDTGYLKVNDGNEKSLSRFDVGGKRLEKGLKGYVYGERGVWRPGDTLHVTLLLHDREGRIPAGHPAALELYTPEGRFYCKHVCREGVDGFYAFSVPTRADDPTGIWNAYIKVGGAAFHKALRIETVKPNRLKIETDLGGNLLQAGSRIPLRLASQWLTGPAASGLKAGVSLTLRRQNAAFKGFEGYVFTDPTSTFTTSEHALWSGRLDGEGKAGATVAVPTAADAPGMLTATLLSTVTEEGGDESFVTTTLPFSPFSAYVGVKAPEGDLETDQDLAFKVAVVSADGKRVSGHRLEYKIFKTEWSWWWENDADQLGSYVHGADAKTWASGLLTSTDIDVTVPLRVDYPEWGRFLIYVKDLDSGHASGLVTFVDWPSWRGRADRRDPDALTMLSFSTDKKSYAVGETVTVYIPAADKGKALVSLENGSGVISRKWVATAADKDTPYQFKVTADMAPNFYVHVTLLQPHQNTANDLPIRMYGVVPVLVSNPGSHLEPVITMADSVHPEEEFTVKVSEKNGKPMTYTLAIVDEGLLDITGFKTPDPWNALYAREALGVSTFDLYDQVCGAFAGRFSPMLGIGGDEDMMTGNKRDNRFNAVVKVLGPFTMKRGGDSHRIKLPMYVGSVRVMVVAGTAAGAYGNAQKSVTVKSPLMVVPTLPRVISTGEQVTLPVNVFVLEDGISSAKVKVEAEGPVRLAGPAESTLSFSKPGDEMVRFALETTGEGFAHITVSASGNGQRTSETIHIEVRNPSPWLVDVQRRAIAPGSESTFVWNAFPDEGQARAQLSLTSFPAIDFNAAFRYVRDYPYNCSEQLSARGINLVYTQDFLTEENAAKAREMVPVLLQELYGRQLADGGIAYWPGAASADTWVTSMAGVFMLEAKAKGFEVNNGVLNSWKAFQKKAVQNWRKAANRNLDDLDQAYRLYTLALAGNSDQASMNRLKESENLSIQGRRMLAAAYAVSGKADIALGLLQADEKVFEAYLNDRISYGSSTRDQAMAVEALTLAGDIPGALELADEVAGSFRSGYYSTQELAFASVAMKRLAAKTNNAALACTVDGKEISSPQAHYTAALNPTTGKVSARNRSEGTVYASLVTVSRPAGPVAADAEGLRLNVSYRDADGRDVNPASLPQGTEFTAVITVSNPSLTRDLDHLALTQLVPSGWEIRNERLTGGAEGAYTRLDIRDDRNIWYFDLPMGKSKTFKTRLRAAYEGNFVLPAIQCEAMYDARTYARTASGKAAVTR